ncbi:Common plant regulatory factor [Dionaea muscipula]
MGNSDEAKSTKSVKKGSSTAVEESNVHVYPDWTAMQAYYGHGVSLQPYYNTPAGSGHPPPAYMWGPPQPMIPPYGTPYAAIYPHGGVYAHPAVPLASTTLSIDTPPKSSANTDRGLMKKLKGFDGLAMSIGNSDTDNAEGAAENRLAQSVDSEDSSDGSDVNNDEADQGIRKRSLEGTPNAVGSVTPQANASLLLSVQISSPVEKVIGVPATTSNASGSMAGTALHSGMVTALELKNPEVKIKGNPVTAAPTALMSSEAWLQNERELKRERRKQSNRESARRSRLRKQAETEELARKVEILNAENISLKSEINQLKESSEKLKSENASLIEKLRSAELGPPEGIGFSNIESNRVAVAITTENLLSRVNNSGSADRNPNEGAAAAMYEKSSNTGSKLHQLMDANPRADAVAAG